MNVATFCALAITDSVTETMLESEDTAVTSVPAGRARSELEIVTVCVAPTRTSKFVTVASSSETNAGFVTVTYTSRSGWPVELKVNTASPETALEILNVAIPEALVVAEGLITMDSLVESTFTREVGTKTSSEEIEMVLDVLPAPRLILDKPWPSTVNAGEDKTSVLAVVTETMTSA